MKKTSIKGDDMNEREKLYEENYKPNLLGNLRSLLWLKLAEVIKKRLNFKNYSEFLNTFNSIALFYVSLNII